MPGVKIEDRVIGSRKCCYKVYTFGCCCGG
jgi:hypothetical protein